jgi:cyclopropane fatty-acyl-phospholipid synthase-like methyltransferase
MLRKLFYLLPPSWRHALRWLIYLPLDLFSSKKELSPPARLIYTGRGDFIQQGKEWFDFFINHTQLKPTDKVLDIGSGIGRIAIPLKDYLILQYEGFDAVKTGVDWCTKHISSQHPHFRFQYFPLHNDLYNQSALQASQFVFPYSESEFDFACAISVFTHMLPEEVENYISQMAKVLKPEAKAVCTFFILNEHSIQSMNNQNSSFKFNITNQGQFALMDEKVKSANVAYFENYIENLISNYSFRIITKIPGHWSGKEKNMDLAFQDIWVMEKKVIS